MALTDRQKLARQGKITASRIGVLMSGDARAIYDLWLELTGDPSFEPPDFSNVWAIQLGNATEKFHLDWIERSLGLINERGKSHQHPKVSWALATLDGWIVNERIAVEAKHTGGFEPMDTIIDRYMPQMHWTMWCTETEEIAFSVIMGAKEPKPLIIKFDHGYMAELIERGEEFIDHVHNLTEPVANPYLKPPKPVFSRSIDMSGNNEWGFHASGWLSNRVAFQKYNESATAIKNLMPSDAKEGFGHGIIVTRSKAGALTIKPEKDNGEG
jgi:predicted phage-related endonuclease